MVALGYFRGRRVQKMSEKASPAKKVLNARAVFPDRSPSMADAVQHTMITTIPASIRLRRTAGPSMW